MPAQRLHACTVLHPARTCLHDICFHVSCPPNPLPTLLCVLQRTGSPLALNSLGTANVVSCASNTVGCGACAPGTSSTPLLGTGNTDSVCTLNPPGTDSDGVECAAGSAKSDLGAGTCTACSPGYFSKDAGSSVCTACAAGNYASAASATSCLGCGSAQLPAMDHCPGTCPKTSQAFTLDTDLTGSLPAAYSPPALLTSGCTLTAGSVFGMTTSDDCSVVVFPLGDPVCSDGSSTTYGLVPLKGYVYQDTIFMARLPEPYGDGTEQ